MRDEQSANLRHPPFQSCGEVSARDESALSRIFSSTVPRRACGLLCGHMAPIHVYGAEVGLLTALHGIRLLNRSQVGAITMAAMTIALVSCGNHSTNTSEVAGQPNGAAAVPNYAPRIGVGVATQSRTCFAIANPNLTAGAPVTLVSPITPQSFVQGQITGPAQGPCPVFRNSETGFSSYEVSTSQPSANAAQPSSVPKLTPLIALAGPIGPMMANGGTVSVDLDQNGKTQNFRACSAADNVYLTVWSGAPLTGTVLWRGSYYAPDNPGIAPACDARELPGR
jgi:hypothetical protein